MSHTVDARQQPDDPVHLAVPELPKRILETYSRLWQLEIWLRRLIYVELSALAADEWTTEVHGAEKPWEADKRLTHMPTPERDPLSYVQFSELRRVISAQWQLFESFLPPQSLWEAKLEEIVQIRHRVAHFRRGHQDDLQRVVQFLRDLDDGFWRFCTSYNDPQPVLPQSDDPVVANFLHLDPFAWGDVGDGKWARIGIAGPEVRFVVRIEVLCRPWARWATPAAGHPGLLYDVTIHARHQSHLEYRRLLESTSRLHKHVVHICLDSVAKSIRITIPTVLGAERVIPIVEQFYEASLYCLVAGLSQQSDHAVQAFSDTWPSYVLGPENPLTFLSPDMPCSFFGV